MEKRIERKWLEMVYSLASTFTDIPNEEWERVTSQSAIKTLSLNKNEYFIRSGSIPDKIAFILSGIFRVFFLTETGDEKVLAFREEGRVISAFSAFLKNEPSWFNIQALSDANLLYIHLDEYQKILTSHPCWQTINVKYIEKLFIEQEEREREFLSDDAETRYKNFILRHPTIENRIHQYQIASYLGITPVTLSRIRKKR